MSDDLLHWAEHIAASRRRESAQRELEQRKVLSDRALIAKAAPRLWSGLVEEVKARLDALEQAMPGPQPLKLKLDAGRKRLALVSAATDREVYALAFHPGEYYLATTDGNYRLVASGVSDILWSDVKFGGMSSSESIATLAIERALRGA